MEKLEVEYWDEEISSLSNEIVNGIESALSEIPNNRIDFKNVNLTDGCGSKIEHIELANTTAYGDDIYITTKDCKDSLLREEPISILMDIARYINDFVIKD